MRELDQGIARRTRCDRPAEEDDGAACGKDHIGKNDAGKCRVSDGIADETLPLVDTKRTDRTGGNREHNAAECDDLKGVIE